MSEKPRPSEPPQVDTPSNSDVDAETMENGSKISGGYIEMNFRARTYDVFNEIPELFKDERGVQEISVFTGKTITSPRGHRSISKEHIIVGVFPRMGQSQFTSEIIINRELKARNPEVMAMISAYEKLLSLPGCRVAIVGRMSGEPEEPKIGKIVNY